MKLLLVPRRPYSLALTAERFVRFPEVVDRFDGRLYRRLLGVGRGGTLVSVSQSGTPARAILEVSLEGRDAASAEAGDAARRLVAVALGAGAAVAPFYRAHRSDAMLAAPIRAFRGLRVAGSPSLWEALVTAILAQQVNLRFAYDIRRELSLAFGRRARFGGETFIAFPAPESIAGVAPRALARFRLSAAKSGALAGLARAFAGGALTEAAIAARPDEEAIARLMELRGIGRWTAEIGLLRGLGRPDIFPAGDLGVVKYLAQGLLGHRDKAREDDMRRFAERWKPHRSLALVYGYAELSRRKAASSPPESPTAPTPARGSGRPRRG